MLYRAVRSKKTALGFFSTLNVECTKPRKQVSGVVEWLERCAYDQHDVGLKPTRAILLCSWEKHFTALSLLGGVGKQF